MTKLESAPYPKCWLEWYADDKDVWDETIGDESEWGEAEAQERISESVYETYILNKPNHNELYLNFEELCKKGDKTWIEIEDILKSPIKEDNGEEEEVIDSP